MTVIAARLVAGFERAKKDNEMEACKGHILIGKQQIQKNNVKLIRITLKSTNPHHSTKLMSKGLDVSNKKEKKKNHEEM